MTNPLVFIFKQREIDLQMRELGEVKSKPVDKKEAGVKGHTPNTK
jgi:hypothetical protein